MPSAFWDKVVQRNRSALESGDLAPLETEEATIQEAGLPFTIRWAASLADKDVAREKDAASATLPGGPRDPDFNPFLNPDPALLVGPIGEAHQAILNKFPVCEHHLVLARREFAEQLAPLETSDFLALAHVMSARGGLGFYNGGPAAGASQRHKHVQWIPPAAGNASLHALVTQLAPAAASTDTHFHDNLPFRHCFIRVKAGQGMDEAASAASMLEGFNQARVALQLDVDEDGLLPAFNMLVNDHWMLVVGRSKEHYKDISINALSFGGTLYVPDPAQLDTIRQAGALAVLASVGWPR